MPWVTMSFCSTSAATAGATGRGSAWVIASGATCAVLDWAQAHGFSADRIGWVANSMGASTLLMEAATNASIRVAVVDSPYGSMPGLLDDQLTQYSHLPAWFNPGILTAARWVYGVRTDDLVPIQAVRQWGSRPLLLFHGEADTIVPVEQAHRLARAAGPTCQAVILPGVEHVQTYMLYPGRYIATIHAFFERHLGPLKPLATSKPTATGRE